MFNHPRSLAVCAHSGLRLLAAAPPHPALSRRERVLGLRLLAAAVVAWAIVSGHAQAVKVDPAIPPYARVEGVAGNLNSIGSDTLNNLMTLWSESFRKFYPNVNIQVEGKGSNTAPPALIEKTAQLGPMSREMKSTEMDEFEKRFGYKPTAVRVAIDALAVFVHKDNPIAGLTLQQVDAIFSSTYKRGGQPIQVWGGVGLTGDWANRPLSLYGRNSASGTYGYFKEHALDKGDYKNSVKEQPGSSSVVQGVASEIGGVGYSGIGYLTSDVKAVPLGMEAGRFFAPSLENCLSGDYPLARFLYIYVNREPGKALDKLTLEFLRMVLSKEGQQVVVQDGYYPLPASVVTDELGKIR